MISELLKENQSLSKESRKRVKESRNDQVWYGYEIADDYGHYGDEDNYSETGFNTRKEAREAAENNFPGQKYRVFQYNREDELSWRNESLTTGTDYLDNRDAEILDNVLSYLRNSMGLSDSELLDLATNEFGMTPKEVEIFCGVGPQSFVNESKSKKKVVKESSEEFINTVSYQIRQACRDYVNSGRADAFVDKHPFDGYEEIVDDMAAEVIYELLGDTSTWDYVTYSKFLDMAAEELERINEEYI